MRYNPVVRFFRTFGIKSILFSLFASVAFGVSVVLFLEIRAMLYDDAVTENIANPVSEEEKKENASEIKVIEAKEEEITTADEKSDTENEKKSSEKNEKNLSEIKTVAKTKSDVKKDEKSASATKNENLKTESKIETASEKPAIKSEIKTKADNSDLEAKIENPATETAQNDENALSEPSEEESEQKSIIGTKEKPESAGDIVFSDGSASAYNEPLSSDQEISAIGVVAFVGDGVIGKIGKAYLLGLKEGKNLEWGSDLSNIPNAVCSPPKESAQYESALAFSGETNGYESQTAVIKSDYYNKLSFTFSAFNFALNYFDAGYLNGWYVPSVAELSRIYSNVSVINAALAKISGADFLDSKSYWSSSQYEQYSVSAWKLLVRDGSEAGGLFVAAEKTEASSVRVLHIVE